MGSAFRLVGCLATACLVAMWTTIAAAQLAPVAPEPPLFREQMARAAAQLDRGDLAGAEAIYSVAYAQFPSAEVQWGFGRIAYARSNYGDCRAWLRAALATSLLPLDAAQREQAIALLRAAEREAAPQVNNAVVVLSPAQAASLEARLEPPPLSAPVDRATLWTAVSVVVVAALAGTLVAMSAGGP